jgi:hypothetical protein
LHKKIQDQRFLNLIWKLLNAGYMDLHGAKKESLSGSPQGGLISPILANVYVQECDECMQEMRRTLEKGERKSRNPAYNRLSRKKGLLLKRGETRTKAFKEVVKQMRTLSSRQTDDPNFIRIAYLRYAEDWIGGVGGSHVLAEDLKEQIRTFLGERLKLTLSKEKTCITHMRTEEASFLGTLLSIGKGGEAKITQHTNCLGYSWKRRSTGWQTVMNGTFTKLVKRLSDRGFCTKEGIPTGKAGWSHLDADQINHLYSSVHRGIQNDYRCADNWGHLRTIQSILTHSLMKTLARKDKLSRAKVAKRFGKAISVTVRGKDGKEDRVVSFYQTHHWNKDRNAFQSGKHSDSDVVQTGITRRTRSNLGKPCCICGETAGQIAMHHVRHIRKLSHTREPTGFKRILRAMNRKQVPVCKICHGKIPRGEYDTLKLSTMAYIPS